MPDAATPGARVTVRKGQVAAIIAGNALEFYDFLTYTFFAAQIGRALFPAGNALLLSLATFGIGFTTRPLGGYLLGRMADRRGRRPALLLSFGLTGLSIVGLALTPSFARIGWAAPLLAIGFRLLQGFALGGEVGPSTAYLLEAAPPHRRGLFVSLQYVTQHVAILTAGLVGLSLAVLLSPTAFERWGWRIAFLLGASIVPFGLVLRRRLAETLRPTLADHGLALPPRMTRIAVAGLLLLAGGTIGQYTLNYLTTYAQATLGMSARVGFGSTLLFGVFGALASAGSGWLSDKVGRRPLVIGGCIVLILGIVPCFALMSIVRTPLALWTGTVLLTLMTVCANAPGLVLLTESLPARIRAGALGLLYALSIAVFGGSAQFIEAKLGQVSGSPLAPGFYQTFGTCLALIAVLMLRETNPQIVRRQTVTTCA